MVKVMIVDDEVLVRVGLKTAIDWPKYGFMVVGEAGNGRDALAMLREGNVDVVLLDIKMPIMDGIELLQIIHVEKIPVKVIILSCYDDFDYVKEAMKLGAFDYILKLSLDIDKLVAILKDLKNNIGAHSLKPGLTEDGALQKYCLAILERYDSHSWAAMKQLGMRLNDDNILVFCIAIDSYEEQINSGNIKNPELSGKYIVNTVSDIINNYANGGCFEKSPGDYVAFINPRTPKIESVVNIAEHIIDALKRYSQFSVSIGISNIIESSSRINEGYLQAKRALEKRFFQGKGVICVSENDLTAGTVEKGNILLFTAELERRLRLGLEYSDLGYTMSAVNDFLESVRNQPYPTKEVVLNNIDDIMMIFAKELRIYNKQFDDIPEFSGIDLKTHLRKFDFFKDLTQWLHEFIKIYFDFLLGLNSQHKRRTEILKAIQYIEENYTRNISLTDLAGQVNLSESYLSHLFKKETGSGIANYVLNLRLEMGKKLLKSTNLSVYEIAEKVGYSNVYYFSSSFKKAFGVSPTEYQKIVNKS